MSTLHITFDEHSAHFSDGETSYVVPMGISSLAAMLTADPPLPEELTNAIGIFMDHMEDVSREVPGSVAADGIEVCGPGLQALVDTEIGHAIGLPCLLDRDAAEEVFRTLATEAACDRVRNPGLPADEVHHILGVCCAVVAVLRALQAPALTVHPAHDTPGSA